MLICSLSYASNQSSSDIAGRKYLETLVDAATGDAVAGDESVMELKMLSKLTEADLLGVTVVDMDEVWAAEESKRVEEDVPGGKARSRRRSRKIKVPKEVVEKKKPSRSIKVKDRAGCI